MKRKMRWGKSVVRSMAWVVALAALWGCGDDNPSSPRPSSLGTLTATVGAINVHLVWVTNVPGGPNFRVLRRLDQNPTAADDPRAELAYSGTATTADEPITNLLPNMPAG